MGNSAAYLIAVLIGSIYMMRKLELMRFDAARNPHISEAEFEAWRSREAAACNWVTGACLTMVLVDFAWRSFIARGGVAPNVIRGVGAGIFFAWVLAVALGMVKARSARALRRKLGIEPGKEAPR